jgi:hypothetical protein
MVPSSGAARCSSLSASTGRASNASTQMEKGTDLKQLAQPPRIIPTRSSFEPIPQSGEHAVLHASLQQPVRGSGQ